MAIKCLIQIRPPERTQVKKASLDASDGGRSDPTRRWGNQVIGGEFGWRRFPLQKATRGANEGWLFLRTSSVLTSLELPLCYSNLSIGQPFKDG